MLIGCCVAAETVSGATSSCDGEFDLNGDCYQLHRSFKTWSDADYACSTLGFQLAAVEVNLICTVML